jgi:hypothetical protein
MMKKSKTPSGIRELRPAFFVLIFFGFPASEAGYGRPRGGMTSSTLPPSSTP